MRSFVLVASLFALLVSMASGFGIPSVGRSSVATWGTNTRFAEATMMADGGRDALRTAGPGPAVLDRPETETEVKTKRNAKTKQRQGKGGEPWEVRIYNDGMNTREHVARSLVQITGLSEANAYSTMMQAHQNGMAVVGQWVYEIAEMYHDRLRDNGIICDLVPAGQD